VRVVQDTVVIVVDNLYPEQVTEIYLVSTTAAGTALRPLEGTVRLVLNFWVTSYDPAVTFAKVNDQHR
jgi:hypothetical protein